MTIQLKADKRDKFGKANRALREQGLIPAELYGHGLDNLHISVSVKDFEKVFREAGENTVVELSLDGKKHPAIIHDVQKDFLSDSVEHIDFYEVRMDEVIRVHVPIELIGESPAVKEQGGMLNQSMQEIEVEALPAKVPAKFTLDVSGLIELNQSLYVKDLDIPKDAKIMVEPEAVIVSVMPPRKEEEVKPVEAVDLSAVKVESEEKKAERDKDKEATQDK